MLVMKFLEGKQVVLVWNWII